MFVDRLDSRRHCRNVGGASPTCDRQRHLATAPRHQHQSTAHQRAQADVEHVATTAGILRPARALPLHLRRGKLLLDRCSVPNDV